MQEVKQSKRYEVQSLDGGLSRIAEVPKDWEHGDNFPDWPEDTVWFPTDQATRRLAAMFAPHDDDPEAESDDQGPSSDLEVPQMANVGDRIKVGSECTGDGPA